MQRDAGRAAKVVVVAHDAMHLGARKIQCFGNHGHRCGRYMAECILHRMQQRQQRTRLACVASRQLTHRVLH